MTTANKKRKTRKSKQAKFGKNRPLFIVDFSGRRSVDFLQDVFRRWLKHHGVDDYRIYVEMAGEIKHGPRWPKNETGFQVVIVDPPEDLPASLDNTGDVDGMVDDIMGKEAVMKPDPSMFLPMDQVDDVGGETSEIEIPKIEVHVEVRQKETWFDRAERLEKAKGRKPFDN